jgi:7,8-dihydropterin-6-yl-methyl-4-(beta-D-ribofuranosyl)aminobenzene 5'-phosphate synthase
MDRKKIAENFGSAEQLSLTVLVDNKADMIVESGETIKYFKDKPLLAEHGFAVLMHFGDEGDCILWDAGVSQVALIENMRRMKVDPKSIKKIVLSHGHNDHFAALSKLLGEMDLLPEGKEWDEPVTAGGVEEWIEENRIPLIAHPSAFRERWWVKKDGTKVGPFLPPPKHEWESRGAKLILTRDAYQLRPGCWTTGYVPRESFEKSGRSEQLLYRDGENLRPDDLDEDQAIIINVKGKGLVVLAGCAHSGIVNTVNHAKANSGVDRILAIIGGFHLAKTKDDEIQLSVDAIKAVEPELIVPCHCTGFRATSRFADQMPDAFSEGVVGATYLF